jgi:hypothetical protein
MSGGYEKANREAIPHAEIAFDSFHCGVPRPARRRPSPTRREKRPRTLAHPQGPAGSRAPAGRCRRAPTSRPSGSSRCSAKSSRPTRRCCAPSCSKRTTVALRARGPDTRPGAHRRLAGPGVQVATTAVRQARTHDPPPPHRHPRRDPTRPLKRATRRPQQPHPPHQPPQLRLPLRRTPLAASQ